MKKKLRALLSGTRTGRKIGVALVLVALLPVIFYTANELSSLSSTEKLIQSIYSKQLDVILFSINQYSLDAAQSWSNEINTLLLSLHPSQLDSSTQIFLFKTPSIRGVLYTDSIGRSIKYMTRRDQNRKEKDEEKIALALSKDSVVLNKLLHYATSGYRKIEPIMIGDSISDRYVLLAFTTKSKYRNQRIAGFMIDTKSFVDGVLESRLVQAAADEFQLAVFDNRNKQIIYSTSATEIQDLEQERELWLLPDYRLGIRLKGTSIEDLVWERSQRNLIIIILLDIILIGAVWILYRVIKKEVELVRLKGDFVSNVSHELRTPLSLIRMYTETLSMKRITTEKKKQEYYTTILNETERLTRLINNILNFSRMEAGKKQYHFSPTNLNEVVVGVMNTFQTHLQHEGFVTKIKFAQHIPSINGDSEAIAEAIINILDNAVKYSGDERFVRIATGLSGTRVFVEIEDHGIGIDIQHREKIFETFYRISTGLTNNVKGSGLGLSLVKHIVDSHGGNIEVYSEISKGSTFRLLFPFLQNQKGS
jgi:two-component system phosphate regulon sensor histidine kinase PhoR